MPITWRLGLFYATVFISSGVGTPYISVWFRDFGLSGGEIGVILAAPMVARTLIGPALAIWADSFRLRRTAIMLLAGLSTAGYAAMLGVHGFWPWLATWFIGVTAYSAAGPLTDVIALRRAQRDGFAYALPRGMGSAAYIVGNIVAGALLPMTGSILAPVWLVVSGVAQTAGARTLLPAETVRESAVAATKANLPHTRIGELSGLLRDPVLLLAMGSVSLVQCSHAFFSAFASLLWRQQGISPSVIGLLWGVGVAAEVAFLWFMEPWRRRLGAERLLVLGAAGATIRWVALAFTPPLWLLFPLQALHAMSFTATFVASLQIVDRLSPRESASSAQTLAAALSFGLATGIATLLAGPLYDHIGPWGYLVMAALAGAGLFAAIRLRARIPNAP